MSAVATLPWFSVDRFDYPLPIPLPGLGETMPVFAFTLLVSIGVLAAARAADEFARRHGRPTDLTAELVLFMVLFGFMGAYVLNGVLYAHETMAQIVDDPRLIAQRWLGLSSYGGFAGGIGGALVWRRLRKAPLLFVGDGAAFAIPFGWLFGRMGCTLVHDHPGIESTFALAIDNYRWGSPPYVARHDLGLYEALFALTICLLFLWLSRKPRPVGFYVAIVALPYSPARFMLDFLRVPPEQGGDARYFGLTPAQYGAVAMMLASLALLAWVLRQGTRHTHPVVR